MLNNNLNVILLTVFAFILRLKFMSPWLEDWDSVQFAIAMDSYSLSEGIPHAPGYPLYILLGKFLFLFFHDHNLSLSFLSSLLGSLSVVPLYLLANKMFNQKVALLSSLIFIFSPVHWTLSEIALTNMPGQFFLLLWIYLLYKFMNNFKAKVMLSGLAGIILGVRFTEFPIIISLLILISLKKFNIRKALFTICSFFLGLASWMVPLMLISGINQFLESYGFIANYIFKHDALLDQGRYGLQTINIRFENFLLLLKWSYTVPFTILGTITVIFVIKNHLFREFKYLFLSLWAASYLLPLLFFYNLEVTRYTLPLLPPLAILTTTQLYKLTKNKIALAGVIGIILGFLIYQSQDQVRRFKNSVPPTVASVDYVRKNFAPHNTTIIPTNTLRHFQYYGSEFPLIDLKNANYNQDFKNKTIIIDFPGTKDKFKELSNYDITKRVDFFGDKDIYNRINKVSIYILKPK